MPGLAPLVPSKILESQSETPKETSLKNKQFSKYECIPLKYIRSCFKFLYSGLGTAIEEE